ncbi:unnamed protein product, partial [Closterium sp. NIES-53]
MACSSPAAVAAIASARLAWAFPLLRVLFARAPGFPSPRRASAVVPHRASASVVPRPFTSPPSPLLPSPLSPIALNHHSPFPACVRLPSPSLHQLHSSLKLPLAPYPRTLSLSRRLALSARGESPRRRAARQQRAWRRQWRRAPRRGWGRASRRAAHSPPPLVPRGTCVPLRAAISPPSSRHLLCTLSIANPCNKSPPPCPPPHPYHRFTPPRQQTAARAFSEAAGVGRGGARVSMALRSGIVGLPNVGKSTLFNALVENGKAVAANFPFCTIEPNVGVVAVPDPRLGVLSDLTSSKRTLPATVEFVDIAGLVKGASQGEGLGNKFLSHIREVDSVVQVVRCFEDTDIVHVSGAVNPTADIDVINLELALSDLSQIEKRLERLSKSRSKDPQARAREEVEAGALERIREALLAGGAARSVELSEEEAPVVAQLCLLTAKPIIYAANVAETDLAHPSSNPHVTAVRQLASSEGAECVVVSAQVEAELCELGEADRAEYLAALGVQQSGGAGLVQATYSALGLRTYFTAGEKETRAWTIRAGMTAPQAAGVIHTDFERGFIRAETISYNDFVASGSYTAAKEKGL